MRRMFLAALVMAWLAPLAPAGAAETLTVAYLELRDDPRYDVGRMEARAHGQPWGRPFAGAEVAAREVRFPLSTRDVKLALERRQATGMDALLEQTRELAGQGVRLFLVDLPAPAVTRVAALAELSDALVFNISAEAQDLRGAGCAANLFHLIPSLAMRMDALAQYLVERRWRKVLLLQGPEGADEALGDGFRTAAERYGLGIVEQRPFVAGQDPRAREANNLDLLTRGSGFDAIFVADADAEFAQRLPYATRAPRPVVGSAGLVPEVWHWNWNNHGARQLNKRFEEHADRRMTSWDWAAWIGVKALAEAIIRTGETGTGALRGYLRGDELVLDGFQGYRLSFRPWNQQLRTPIFLGTPSWVAARAPLEGFLHPRMDLDSLGRDAPETRCELEAGS